MPATRDNKEMYDAAMAEYIRRLDGKKCLCATEAWSRFREAYEIVSKSAG